MAKPTQAEKQRRFEELEDLRLIMATGPGSRFILRLINITGPYRSVFNSDAVLMAWLEGNRNFGCRIVTDLLEACPDLYVRLVSGDNLKKQAMEATNESHKVEQDA